MKDIIAKGDSSLVRSLSTGNILAFNALYKAYSHRLYRFGLAYLKSDSDAQELVQNVFLTIWQKRGTLNDELSFKSFLFTIAFNNIKKHFRTKARIAEYLKTIINYDADNQTAQQIDYSSLHHFVAELIEQLPCRRKEILIKSRIEGLSIQEIAKEMNISHKTVENQLSHSLKFLRDKLKAERSGEFFSF